LKTDFPFVPEYCGAQKRGEVAAQGLFKKKRPAAQTVIAEGQNDYIGAFKMLNSVADSCDAHAQRRAAIMCSCGEQMETCAKPPN
jgi:hypothetical protein